MKGKKLGALSGAVFVFGLASGARAEMPRCETYRSEIRAKQVSYCVQRSRPDVAPQVGEPVAYFFHGMMSRHTAWKDNGYAAAFEELGRRGDLPPMTVVSFETSQMSFFSDRAGRASGEHAYETWFLDEFMPKIEREHRVCAERDCRGLIGYSMGGYGALKTSLKRPELFSFVAVNAAAIAPFNVWNPMSEWNAYFSRHPIGRLEGGVLIRRIRGIFTDAAMYEANDPISLVRAMRPLDPVPALYLDVGGKDYFGFEEGYFAFTELLRERGIAFEGHFLPDLGHSLQEQRRWPLLGFVGAQLAGY